MTLDNITLLGIDCIDIERLIVASNISQKYLKFKEVKLLTHFKHINDNRIIYIPKIHNIEEYSEFIFNK